MLIVTTFGRPGYLRRALQAGASGFVVKDTPAAQLADAVRRVHAGLRVVDPALATDRLVAGESPLTPRETEVLRAARDGSSVAAIARKLFLSEGTVRNHLSSAIGKTGATNRAEAVHHRRGQRLALSRPCSHATVVRARVSSAVSTSLAHAPRLSRCSPPSACPRRIGRDRGRRAGVDARSSHASPCPSSRSAAVVSHLDHPWDVKSLPRRAC